MTATVPSWHRFDAPAASRAAQRSASRNFVLPGKANSKDGCRRCTNPPPPAVLEFDQEIPRSLTKQSPIARPEDRNGNLLLRAIRAERWQPSAAGYRNTPAA
jgi:hypothetical protein